MSNDLIITPIPISLVDFVWDECKPILNKVVRLAEEEISLKTIREALLRGDQLMIAVLDKNKIVAVNILETLTFATGLRVLNIPIVAGERMSEWAERFLNICTILAKDDNCTELRGMAVRKGWGKFLKQFGWDDHFVVMRCPIKSIKDSTIIDNVKNINERK